jgi:hypothetical protein
MTEEEKQNVMKAMELYLESGLMVRFLRTDKIERTAAGKLKHFFSEL